MMPQPSTRVAFVAWSILAFLLLPTLIVIPAAFSDSLFLSFPPTGLSIRWFVAFFTSEKWLAATGRSLRIGIAAMLLATSIATLSAVLLSRASPLVNKLARATFMAPMTLPVIVYAVAVYSLYAKLRIVGTDAALILSHAILALPFPFLTVSAAMATMDQSLPKAAASCGANAFRAFWWVTLPIIKPGVAAGALFAFLTSFDEVVVAMFVGGTEPTLPMRLLDDIRFELTPILAAVSTLLTCVTAAGIVIASRRRLPMMRE